MSLVETLNFRRPSSISSINTLKGVPEMASQKNNRRNNGMSVRFADHIVVSMGKRPTPSAVLEYRNKQEVKNAEVTAKQAAKLQLLPVVFVLLVAKAVELYEIEWKEVRTRISKERNRIPKPLTQEQSDRLVQKEHENALKDRLARAVFENLEVLLEDSKDFGPHLFKTAREMTAAQVPVSLWAKYSDEQGNPLPDNPIDKGLGKGVYFLHQALSVLLSEHEQGPSES